MIVVAASNHNSNEAYYPGSLDNVITVVSTVGNGSHALFQILAIGLTFRHPVLKFCQPAISEMDKALMCP